VTYAGGGIISGWIASPAVGHPTLSVKHCIEIGTNALPATPLVGCTGVGSDRPGVAVVEDLDLIESGKVMGTLLV